MNNDQIYDLEKLEPEKLRLKKRKKLFKRTIILSVVCLVIAFKLMSLTIFTAGAISSLNANNAPQAIQRLSPIGLLNIIEGFKFHFNIGDAYYRNGEFVKAENSFRNAQKSVPKSFFCQLTLNLVLSIEAQADQAVLAKDYDKAILKYDEVKAIVRDSKCGFSVKEQKADESMKKVAEESKKKSDEAKQSRNGDKANEKNKTQSKNTPTEPSKEQSDKLTKNAERNIRLRQLRQSQNAGNDFDYSKRKYDAKNW